MLIARPCNPLHDHTIFYRRFNSHLLQCSTHLHTFKFIKLFAYNTPTPPRTARSSINKQTHIRHTFRLLSLFLFLPLSTLLIDFQILSATCEQTQEHECRANTFSTSLQFTSLLYTSFLKLKCELFVKSSRRNFAFKTLSLIFELIDLNSLKLIFFKIILKMFQIFRTLFSVVFSQINLSLLL